MLIVSFHTFAAAPLYSSGNCNGKTYPIGDASSLCSGSGGPPSSPLPTTMQTTTKVTSNAPGPTCAWDGHCQGMMKGPIFPHSFSVFANSTTQVRRAQLTTTAVIHGPASMVFAVDHRDCM